MFQNFFDNNLKNKIWFIVCIKIWIKSDKIEKINFPKFKYGIEGADHSLFKNVEWFPIVSQIIFDGFLKTTSNCNCFFYIHINRWVRQEGEMGWVT